MRPKPAWCCCDDERRSARHAGKRRGDWGRRLVILIPALWLAVFFLVPCLIVLKISLSQTAIAQPPYVPVLDLAAGWPGLRDFVAGAVARQLSSCSAPTGSI